jgi:RNA polymerase sigma-70 factor (ECF subfamily)
MIIQFPGMRRMTPTGQDMVAHLGALRRYALVLTRNPDQAEDLVQEALARAIGAASTWRPGSDLRRWLLAIVHNLHNQRQRRRQLEISATSEAGWLLEEAAPAAQPDRVHLTQTIAALMALSEEQREALILIAFEGLSYRDAAAILGIPTGTLMSRLARGREALRAATGRGETASPDTIASRRPAFRLVK